MSIRNDPQNFLSQNHWYTKNESTGITFFCLLSIVAENVLVLEGGRRVKLTDFGTAAHIDDIAGSISKLKGVTPHFTSPEVVY